MNVKDLEGMLERIDSLKTQKAKAEGAVENIVEEWKNKFEINSLEEAESKLKALEDELEETETIAEKKYTELKRSLDEFAGA